jgi:peptidoglycan/xylan/chitin deacetylase (PgdA/CDA1 family)
MSGTCPSVVHAGSSFVSESRVQGTAGAELPEPPRKARFLLTFDDGPHANTSAVLRQLARNQLQQNIKAIFFVQTRTASGGGSRWGQFILQKQHAEGHVLGLHTGTESHVSHTRLSRAEFDRSMRNGMEDISRITRKPVLFVRPPYWRFNASTLSGYTRHGLHMMLTDIKAYDGLNLGWHLFRRKNFGGQLRSVRRRLTNEELPKVDDAVPIVVTFHDTNRYTASHISEYLDLLVDESVKSGMPLDNKCFYDETLPVVGAGLQRTTAPADQALPRMERAGEC